MEQLRTEQGTDKQFTEGDTRYQNQLFTQLNNTAELDGGRTSRQQGTNTDQLDQQLSGEQPSYQDKIQILPVQMFDFNQIK